MCLHFLFRDCKFVLFTQYAQRWIFEDNNVFFFKIPKTTIIEVEMCAWCGIMVFLCLDYESKSAHHLRSLESGFFLYIINIKRSHKSHMPLDLKPSKITWFGFKMTLNCFFCVEMFLSQLCKHHNSIKYPNIENCTCISLFWKWMTFLFRTKIVT